LHPEVRLESIGRIIVRATIDPSFWFWPVIGSSSATQ
jgi:hypothetical protein